MSADSVAYAAVPNWTAPVIIAPRRPRRTMAATIRGYNTASQGRKRVMAQLAALVASTGVTDFLFESVWVDDSAADSNSSIGKHIEDILGQEVFISISTGPKRAVQKPVIQVSAGSGHPLAFAKVGQNALTRKLVEREASNLRHLQTALASGHGVDVPSLLSAEPWRDTYVLVQSALRRGHEPGREQFLSAMRTVSRLDGVRGGAVNASSYWTALRDRVSRLPETQPASVLRSAIATLDEDLPPVSMPFGSWHGDLTPWNITSDAQEVRIWDWEHYGKDVPVGFDVLHYDIQKQVSQERVAPTDAIDATFRSAPRILADLDVPGAAAPWAALLYIAEIATRYVEDGEQEGETKMGSLSWLEPTIRRQLAVLRGGMG